MAKKDKVRRETAAEPGHWETENGVGSSPRNWEGPAIQTEAPAGLSR